MDGSRRIGMGLIGCGGISRIAHIPALTSVPNCEVIATCDINSGLAEEAGKRCGARNWYTSYEALLREEDVEAVIVATPNYLHREMVVAAAEVGKHVFCEKPLACTNSETSEILDAVRKHNVKLQVGHNQRFWAQHEIVKELLDAGTVGDVLSCRSSLRESYKLYPEQVAVTKYRYFSQQAGAGVLFDICTHRIDLLRWFVGEIIKVFGSALRQAEYSKLSMLEDNAMILCQFENGAIGVIDGDRYTPAGSDITELYGTEGTIFVSSESFNPFHPSPMAVYTEKAVEHIPEILNRYFYPPNWWIKSPTKKWVTISPPRENPYVKQLSHFCECILEDKQPKVSGEDGAKAVEVALATFKSMQDETWVSLPLKEDVVPPGYRGKQ